MRTMFLACAMLAGLLLPYSASSTAFNWPDAGVFWADSPMEMMRLSVVPLHRFDDGCCGTPLWRGARTQVVCSVHDVALRIGPDVQMWRGVQTATADMDDGGSVPTLFPVHASQPYREMPFTTTYGSLSSQAGRSRALYRRSRRCRRTRVSNDDEANSWWVNVMAAVVGCVTSMDPATACAVWVGLTAAVGVYWLVTNQHFVPPLCKVLSLNYWCACASMMWAFSPTVGAMLGITAILRRRSLLLFPDKQGMGGAAADGM